MIASAIMIAVVVVQMGKDVTDAMNIMKSLMVIAGIGICLEVGGGMYIVL